ncbi:MmgE/PrpD family protein [Bradyrhizobium canariense]|uniref:MmgE/PrpD family protein n=1 Tax=Bradyrhizobium canariense TaxID=255045 RepID=UPI001B89FCED|nr:MmgE/PrpD family protein [Bradyrhizobium canariense]MBR0953582.1 MmgE/PrpD family protein [Bradyrhizobium canariense]
MNDHTAVAPSIGRNIAAILAGLSYDDLRDDVVRTTKLFTLDTLGVIAGAAKAPGMAELVSALTAWESSGKATLLLNSSTVNPVTAALANGAAAHSLDFDDQHDPARVHVFCVVLPAVLAAIEAQDEPTTGRQFITAVTLGVELFCRLGLACYNSLGKGWHPTTALGSIAAAAAAAKVFGLDAERTLHAMGLAFVQLSGTTQFIADGALAKRIGPGFASRSGLLAAHLAANGITGPWRFLEGEAGLFQLYERGEVRSEILTNGLGTDWRMRDLSMKPYPCCRCVHTTIQLALDVRAQGINGDDITSGTIELSEVNTKIVGANFDRGHPNPVVHAQFNAAYAFAAALTDGKVEIATFAPNRIRAADVAFATLVQTVAAADIESTAIAPARVRLHLRDGRIIAEERRAMKGSPDEPMSEAEVFAKFRSCVQWGFDADDSRIAALQQALMQLDGLGDAREIVHLFLRCRPGALAA